MKTHRAPSRTVKCLLALGRLRVVYIYRDPRDVLLSAIDHGRRITEKGEKHTFARMTDFDSAFQGVSRWIRRWRQYSNLKKIVMVRYEDLVNNPVKVVETILEYLKISLSVENIREILRRFNPANLSDTQKQQLHFNKARIQRYKKKCRQIRYRGFTKSLETLWRKWDINLKLLH